VVQNTTKYFQYAEHFFGQLIFDIMNMEIIALPSVITMHRFVMSPPLGQGALSDDACLTFVCLASICLSRTCLREQRGLAGTAFLVIFSLLVNRSSSRLQVNLLLADIPRLHGGISFSFLFTNVC